MEKKKNSFLDLVSIMTSKEMKSITGGTIVYCGVRCNYGGGDIEKYVACASTDLCECASYEPPNGCEFIGNCGC